MNQTALNVAENAVFPIIIENRFGELVILEENVLQLPDTIYGFPNYHSYALVKLPGSEDNGFQILQCLNDVSIAFLLTPLQNGDTYLVPTNDLQEATEALGLNFDLCSFFAITTIKNKSDKHEFTINLRAPIVIDNISRSAWQHILEKSDYPIQYKIK